MLIPAQDTPLHAPLRRPDGAASAYGAMIRGTEEPRNIEYRVLARATALLEEAARPGAGPAELPGAIHENRMVWATFALDLAGQNNDWNDTMKAGILSLARWVFVESDRILHERGNPQALCDINRSIMLGLQPPAETSLEHG